MNHMLLLLDYIVRWKIGKEFGYKINNKLELVQTAAVDFILRNVIATAMHDSHQTGVINFITISRGADCQVQDEKAHCWWS